MDGCPKLPPDHPLRRPLHWLKSRQRAGPRILPFRRPRVVAPWEEDEPRAAIAFVRKAGASVSEGGPSATGFNASVFASNTAGNLLTAELGIARSDAGAAAATGITDTAGNTWLKADNVNFPTAADAFHNGGDVSLWYVKSCLASAGNNTLTIAFSGGGSVFYGVGAMEYSGQDTTSPLVLSNHNNGNDASPTVTLTNPSGSGLLYVGVAGGGDASETWVHAGGSWTSRYDNSGSSNYLLDAEDIVGSSGTQTFNPTFNNAQRWGAVIAAFKPAAGGGATPNFLTLLGAGA